MLCGEGLSSLVNRFEATEHIQGLDISRGGSRLHHLLFTYDYILYCRANIKKWNNIDLSLDQYQKASGQTLNIQNHAYSLGKLPVLVSNNKSWKL